MAVARITQVIGASPHSWEDAVRNALEGAIDFERLLADLAAGLHLIPRYAERAVSVPFNLAHPTWEPDPNFDIRHHVLHQKLRPPGSDEQLVTLVSRLFAQPLKRSRPL